jgi:hypothetical protein
MIVVARYLSKVIGDGEYTFTVLVSLLVADTSAWYTAMSEAVGAIKLDSSPGKLTLTEAFRALMSSKISSFPV